MVMQNTTQEIKSLFHRIKQYARARFKEISKTVSEPATEGNENFSLKW